MAKSIAELKKRCPLGGDGTQDCSGCTWNCARNRELLKRRKEQEKKNNG